MGDSWDLVLVVGGVALSGPGVQWYVCVFGDDLRLTYIVNRQWRICFTWHQGEPGPSDVEIVDYH